MYAVVFSDKNGKGLIVMKQLVSAILALCLAAMLVPALAEDDITGAWYLNRAKTQGVEEMRVISDEIQMTFTFREDGTAELFSLLSGAEPLKEYGSWTFADGKITFVNSVNDTVTELEYAGGEISVEASGALMILTREQYTPYVQPAAVKAETMDAFFGTWYPEISFQYGMMACLGGAMAVEDRSKLLIVADTMTETSSGGAVITYMDPVLDPETGILGAALDAQGKEAEVHFTLLEDGTMLVTGHVDELEVMRSIYCRLTAE